MSDTKQKYFKFKNQVPPEVILVAVSKTKPEEDILDLYNEGHRIFGENKIQDLAKKAESLPKDIQWHMIGHLQTNKVKFIAPFVSLIHAVDSMKLLRTINKEAEKYNRVIDCLLQVHIASEETKFGLGEDEVEGFLEDVSEADLKNVRITGLMGMATFTDNFQQVREEFRKLKLIFEELKEKNSETSSDFKELSMGMSNDYPIAIEEGATMIRIGSLIFGERNYTK